jgi:hypothetical protein
VTIPKASARGRAAGSKTPLAIVSNVMSETRGRRSQKPSIADEPVTPTLEGRLLLWPTWRNVSEIESNYPQMVIEPTWMPREAFDANIDNAEPPTRASRIIRPTES